MEIADIHVVSKSDKPDSTRTITDLKHMLTMGTRLDRKTSWWPPVVATSSLKEEGFDELVAAIEKHKSFLATHEAGRARVRRIAEFRMLKMAEELLRIRFRETSKTRVAGVAERLAARQISPYVAGEQLLAVSGA
jgi:LAO/AO transport system kinase